MTGRSLIGLAIAGVLISAGFGPVLAQTSPNATASPASPLTPTPLALPRQNGPPQIDTTKTSASQTDMPPIAITPPDTSQSSASPNNTPRSAPHRSLSPAAAAAKGILVVTTQHSTWGRISFVLRGNPAPDVHPVPGGIELHLAAGVHLELPSSAQLRETGPIEVRDDGGAAVAVIHLACHCSPEQDNGSGFLRLDIHQDPTPALEPGKTPVPAAAKDVAAKAPTAPNRETAAETQTTPRQETAAKAGTDGKTPVAANPVSETTPRTEATAPQSTGTASAVKPASGARTETEARSEGAAKPASGASVVSRTISDAATRSVPEPKPEVAAKAVVAAKPSEAEEMARLRAFLTEKLAKLNATPPQVTLPPRSALRSDAAASRPAPLVRGVAPATGEATAPAQQDQSGPCLARVNASGWRGTGSFTERLVALRAQLARSRSAGEDVAALAEFYLANGLGHEAMAAATEALAMDAAPEVRLRLTRDADIGSLVKGEKLSPTSPLLSNPANCQRVDATLWRDLAAAAEGDAEGAARDPEVAAAALRALPEPLQRELAFRIVGAVGDNPNALRAMAGAMRNATTELPEDEARRFLLQARISGLTGDHAEYAVFLERAARFDMTPAGVTAKARLAAIRAGEGGPAAGHAEAVLIDIARTYRHDALGQQAAEQYAELRLRRHDYAAALAIADESAGPHGPQTHESRGASLVLRILRSLFVDPGTAALPEPSERIALYLRYGGYATPGEKGDDIRLAAARLMLAQRLPDAALDTLRLLSETSAATPEASQMLATAEAYGGDPAKAIDLVKALPEGTAAHRIASEALRRMRQPLQAAHALDGETAIDDREWRASLLFEAEAWPDAAAAYADLLRDPALPAARRNDLATRYALAVAMNGPAANVTVMKLPEGPARLLAAVPQPAPAGQPGLTALRGALERARHIETLLDPPTAHQGS